MTLRSKRSIRSSGERCWQPRKERARSAAAAPRSATVRCRRWGLRATGCCWAMAAASAAGMAAAACLPRA
eukprot:106152-Chlamydomonas_euryale.AAC.2